MRFYNLGESDTAYDYLVEVMYRNHIVASRSVARHFITTGGVKVDGEIVTDPLKQVSVTANIRLIGREAR